jgi:rSAM/selenodomain-associated transferase 2
MISIIIPTYNEETSIEKTLVQLSEIKCRVDKEIIISDGGSTDGTVALASRFANVIKSEKGKAIQLNNGAKHAKGDILFFVHADMFVPDGALTQICNQLNNGFDGGGFLNVFSSHNEKIKRLGRIMNFRIRKGEQPDKLIFYGDNGIFVRKRVFDEMKGFKEIPIMEDYDFSYRLRSRYRVTKIDEPRIVVDSRRHLKSGFLKTRMQWIVIRKLYKLGISPFALAKWYADVR